MKKMTKGRRVGTLTSGIILVILGVIFLLRTFIPSMRVIWIISCWPVILILVGCEVLASYVINREEKIQYDFAGIILVIILSFFAIGMGGVDYLLQHHQTDMHWEYTN